MVRYHESVVDTIGGTPLVRLRRTAEGLAPTVLAKLEYFNPGGSVKDRIALRMVEEAERSGQLRPGGTIVEPTSGNTGVGLALVAQQRGYRCVFTCPDKVSADKIAVLRALGAEVMVCPAAIPPDHPESYRSVAARLAATVPGAYRPDQYASPHNAASHYAQTGPELWEQTEGRITHFVASIGTGGTISGTGRYLKDVSGGAVQVIGADPHGSIYSGGAGRPYVVEGVGQPSFPRSYDAGVADQVIAITDAASVMFTRRLAREEGILTGGSGGMAVAAALQVAAGCGPDDLVVVLVPDSGRGYLSKLFNDEWLQRHGFADPPGEGTRVGDVLPPARAGSPATIAPACTLAEAVAVMWRLGAGLLLVSDAKPPVRLAEVVGVVDRRQLAAALAAGTARAGDPVGAHLSAPPSPAGTGQFLRDVAGQLRAQGAVLVVDGGLVRGVLSAQDVLAGLGGAGPAVNPVTGPAGSPAAAPATSPGTAPAGRPTTGAPR